MLGIQERDMGALTPAGLARAWAYVDAKLKAGSEGR